MFIMFMGVGIIGALASILASLLVGSSAPADEEAPLAEPAPTVEIEIAVIKNELAAMRQLLEKMTTGGGAE
jgi:Na+-transporting methylmalonyl-CoA/oxaloacetate decarboxylase gamma subunit